MSIPKSKSRFSDILQFPMSRKFQSSLQIFREGLPKKNRIKTEEFGNLLKNS